MSYNILCYGDSNTYGYDPTNSVRYPKEVRWPGRLATLLGEEYHVIEEGCNGRNAFCETPGEEYTNGTIDLLPILKSHRPIDLLIIMLGSNDMKDYFRFTAEQHAEHMTAMIRAAKEYLGRTQKRAPEILLMAPPVLGKEISSTRFTYCFSDRSVKESEKFADTLVKVAVEEGCRFVNTADYVRSSDVDCLHLMPEEHNKLANALAPICRQILKEWTKKSYRVATNAEMKEIDRIAIEERGIPSLNLMETAALNVTAKVLEMTRRMKNPCVLAVCGSGNNGGDGFASAAQLLSYGITTAAILVGSKEHMTPDCRANMERFEKNGGLVVPFEKGAMPPADCIIDAIFGVGLNREVVGEYYDCIKAINDTHVPVVACDIPSGINGDTGEVMGIAVKAAKTVTFTLPKKGLYEGEGPAYAGRLTIADIGIPADLL